MDASKIEVGKKYSYYPTPAKDRPTHLTVVVEEVAKRVKVRVVSSEEKAGRLRSVSAKNLVDQPDMFGARF